MKTIHTDAAYMGLSSPPKTETQFLPEDGENHQLRIENEPDLEKDGNKQAKVFSSSLCFCLRIGSNNSRSTGIALYLP